MPYPTHYRGNLTLCIATANLWTFPQQLRVRTHAKPYVLSQQPNVRFETHGCELLGGCMCAM